MSIDYSKIRTVTARQMATALQADGFFVRRYAHDDGRRVTLTFHHSSDTFPLPTLQSMIERQARWSKDDIRRLGLLA